MQTTVRSASSGFEWVNPRFAVHRTSPFKTRLVLLSSGAFILLAISMRCEPSEDNTQISFRLISETRLVDSGEIVVHRMDRYHSNVVFDLL